MKWQSTSCLVSTSEMRCSKGVIGVKRMDLLINELDGLLAEILQKGILFINPHRDVFFVKNKKT